MAPPPQRLYAGAHLPLGTLEPATLQRVRVRVRVRIRVRVRVRVRVGMDVSNSFGFRVGMVFALV